MRDLVRKIHDSPFQVMLAVTGGGSASLSELLRVPGASATLIEALVPYASESLDAFVGSKVSPGCSPAASRSMAMAAYLRAAALKPDMDHNQLLGVACTAALTTNRQRRGEVKAFLAIQGVRESRQAQLTFGPAEGNREEEEALVATFIIHNLALACGIKPQPTNLHIVQDLQLACVPSDWPDLLGPETVSSGERTDAGTRTGWSGNVIFPGAFNPYHAGHRKMVEIAEEKLAQKVTLEISIHNVDKLPLDFFEIERRRAQFNVDQSVTFTNAARFAEKSTLFPGATFVVGTDTMKRIADVKYYDDPSEMDTVLSRFKNNNNHFLVFSRDTGHGVQQLDDINLPDKLKMLCTPVSTEEFHFDISSTEIRQSQTGEC